MPPPTPLTAMNWISTASVEADVSEVERLDGEMVATDPCCMPSGE